MQIIGHRGARGLSPENTIPSFEHAIELGVDMIELDTRVTSDGVSVVAHDPRVDGAVVATTPITDLRVTTLYDALLAINRRVPVYVEIKPGVAAEPVFAVIAKFLSNGWQPEDFLFGSFDPQILRKAQSALPEIERIVIEKWSAVRAVHRARAVGAQHIAMSDRWLWSGVIRGLTRAGFALYSYPQPKYRDAVSNNPTRANRWAHHGLAGIVTDFPDRFMR